MKTVNVDYSSKKLGWKRRERAANRERVEGLFLK